MKKKLTTIYNSGNISNVKHTLTKDHTKQGCEEMTTKIGPSDQVDTFQTCLLQYKNIYTFRTGIYLLKPQPQHSL